ncbi:MAG: aminodeoxychorismate synthase component I [Prevotella sp.]|uniref:aminodeoxychorismate synthase component I n=1 Tax=Prevotella sp. TaxID=59823 RepID=UPI002A349CD4|nr:aminodeoxychorismate synthase component I [Prevotella sp.]MDD7317949.1 aminodeoxychorismate synthase component I [Prevotellaceae bacterium]MDY4020840.1 aminodeoxychorismate synthase component I [Prevotella sp.]
MKTYDRQEAEKKINELGRTDRAFFFIISYDQSRVYIEETENIDSDELLVSFPEFSNIGHGMTCPDIAPTLEFSLPDRERYERSINLVKRNQREGNSYLANLTCRMPIKTNLTMRDIFLRSQAKYRCWLRDRFVCFSPETFVKVEKGVISSFPMKGTLDATLPNAEHMLMDNRKEAAEHATIVDLIRNDLSQVAEQVRVEKYRYVEHLATHKGEILQTSSEITGTLTDYYREHLGEMLLRLLPAGSITGAPKPKTMQIISEAEDYERGFYTGIMGYSKGGDMDTAVMIRFIDCENGQLFYKAGGGITAQSDNDDEYNEVIEKIYVPIY